MKGYGQVYVWDHFGHMSSIIRILITNVLSAMLNSIFFLDTVQEDRLPETHYRDCGGLAD